ncbi:MAG: 4a-hydroxytetrahydrobiopterin dehydratase, partial [Bacteroidota bacterium]
SNVYNRVRLVLTTHDAGNQVTELDLELAKRINAL